MVLRKGSAFQVIRASLPWGEMSGISQMGSYDLVNIYWDIYWKATVC